MEQSEIKRERSLGHSDHSRLECNTCLDSLPASFISKMDSFLEYFTSTEETLQEKKQVKLEVAEELKDTCWLEEKIYESQIQSLKENYNWDVFKREIKKEEVGIFLTKIEFNLGGFGLFLILQLKFIPRVIKALKLLDEMPYMGYMSFIRTPDGFEWKKFKIS